MSQSRTIAAALCVGVGALALPVFAQQSGDQAKAPPAAHTPPPPPPPPPQVITPVRGKTGFGVPAALPGPIKGGFGVTPAIGVPQKHPTNIHNIPIITPPPAHSIPQAPAPNDGLDGRASLRRWINSGNDGNIYVYDWRYMGYPNGYDGSVSIPADRRYVGTWNPWGYNNGWGVPVVDVSSGNVRGYYSGNNWGMAFQLGAGFPTVNYSSYSSLDKYPSRLYRSYYAPWKGNVGYSNGQIYDQNGAIYGYYDPYLVVGADKSVIVDQRLLSPGPNAPAREATALERAEYAMRTGNATEAVKQLKEHLKGAPDDAGVERLLAIALLDDRKTEQAIAVMLHAYTKQPQLARDPIDPYVVGNGADYDHHLRFTKVMEYANRVKTGSAYLAAAVLAQSEGRLDTAKKLLDKAAAEGVDKKVADELALALASK
jgi:hypothetical protein